MITVRVKSKNSADMNGIWNIRENLVVAPAMHGAIVVDINNKMIIFYILVMAQIRNEIFSQYCKINPLHLEESEYARYWVNTDRFITELNGVLGTDNHPFSVNNIMTDNYYFLSKLCVDRSFDLTDLINIMNDRTDKYNKKLANELAHHVLPGYIISTNYEPTKPYQPQPQQQIHSQYQSPFQAQYHAPMLPPYQQVYGQALSFPYMQTMYPPMSIYPPIYPPIAHQQIPVKTASTIPSNNTSQAKLPKPRIKPRIIDHGDRKEPTQESKLPKLIPKFGEDYIPLGFYDAYHNHFSSNKDEIITPPKISLIPQYPPPIPIEAEPERHEVSIQIDTMESD